jgi:hypothetical protein
MEEEAQPKIFVLPLIVSLVLRDKWYKPRKNVTIARLLFLSSDLSEGRIGKKFASLRTADLRSSE